MVAVAVRRNYMVLFHECNLTNGLGPQPVPAAAETQTGKPVAVVHVWGVNWSHDKQEGSSPRGEPKVWLRRF